jgi:hypothetical protein
MKNQLLTLFTLLILGVCIQPSELSAQEADNSVSYYLSEGACYGSCCVYELEISIDGTATMEGQEHCNLRGRYAKTISNQMLSKIGKLFDSVNFAKLPDSYESQIPDLPSVTIGLTKNGVRKKVTFKENRPDELRAIEEALKSVANSNEGWSPFKPEKDINNGVKETLTSAGGLSVKETEQSQGIKLQNSLESAQQENEVIVTTTRGVDFHHWFESNTKRYGLTKKRLWSPDSDRWVITFDPNKRTLEEVVKGLNSDSSVTVVVKDK